MQRRISFLGLALLIAAFIVVLLRYGGSWLVPWHDEVVIVRLAQNLAKGKGFRNDFLDALFTTNFVGVSFGS